jgi:hypothetical protein
MDRKQFHPAELKLDAQGYIEAAFAQLNVVDHDGDITRPGAFPIKEVPMSAYNHTSWESSLPVGKGSISERDGWAVFTGQFFMNTTHGRDAFETVKGLGPLAEYSYGYDVTDGGPAVHEGKSVRELRKLDVFEVSPVLMGAGIGTHTLAIKSGGPGPDMPYADHATWVQEAVAAFLKRTDDRAEWRAKEGRVLSAANRAALAALLDSLRSFSGTADELEKFLEQTDPQKAANTVTLDVLLGTARRLGVSI